MQAWNFAALPAFGVIIPAPKYCMKKLLITGYLCGVAALFFLPPALGVTALVIGIIALAKGRIGHGVMLIIVAVTCGVCGTYMGSIAWNDLVFHSTTPSQLTESPITSATTKPTMQNWHVVSLETRVTESNEVYSTYSWKLIIKNDSSEPADFHGWVEFQDADGFKLADDAVNIDRNVQVPAASEGTFTGSRDIESAKKVARTVANISKGD